MPRNWKTLWSHQRQRARMLARQRRRLVALYTAALEKLARLSKLEGMDDHPEDRCQRCGGRNVTWYADSPLWNAVCRPNGEASEQWSILCPICFVEMAEERGIHATSWRWSREGDEPTVDALRCQLANSRDDAEQLQAIIANLTAELANGDERQKRIAREAAEAVRGKP